MSSVSSHDTYARPGDAGAASVRLGVAEDETGRPVGALRIALVAGLGLVLFAGAGWLWARHGGTVFFDTLTAGLGTCL